MAGLNPETMIKLEQFGNRQRRLLLIRAICVAIVSFLTVMSIVAWADWMWILSAKVRWVLSLLGYAIVIGLVWQNSLRKWMSPQYAESLARGFEAAHPELREDLLSAVELSREDASSNGSADFRQLLQDKVAHGIRWVDVRTLLPVRMIGRWLVGAIALVCLFGIVLSVPGLSIRQLMTRAMLPGANVDRVSLTRVTILEPSPASQLVPRGETVGILVELSGPEVDEVVLESYDESEGLKREIMRDQGRRNYAANITVRGQHVDYRILAGDAITRHYTLESRPRPRVEAFQKTYHYPEYTGLDDERVSESGGDLVALEGTTVDVVLQIDQSVSEAKILIETLGEDQIQTIDTAIGADGRLSATIPIQQPGVYKVHLKGAETGFENTFSPRYEIQPEPDLIPRVGFVNLEDTTLLRPSNDLIPMTAIAEDDLPIAELRQLTSINGGPWETQVLEIHPSPRITHQWDMDLLQWSLDSGDVLNVKLVALDRKGQPGESVPLQIVITDDDFDPDRHQGLTVKARIADRLNEFSTAMQESADSAMAIFKRHSETRSIPAEDRVALTDIAAKLQQQAVETRDVADALLPKVPAGIDALEVELVSAMLSQMAADHVFVLNEDLRDLEAADQSAAPDQNAYTRFERDFKSVGDNARWVDERFRDFLTHDLLGGVTIDMDGVLQQQEMVLGSEVPFSPIRLRRHQTVAINYIHALERLMHDHADRVRTSSEGPFHSVQEMIQNYRKEMQEALDNQDDISPLQHVTQRLRDELRGRLRSALPDGNLYAQVVSSRRDLARRAGVLADSIDLTIRAAQELDAARIALSHAKDSTEAETLRKVFDQKLRTFNGRLASVTTQLDDRATSHEARPDRNAQTLADIKLVARAVKTIFPTIATVDSIDGSMVLEKMRIIRDADRELEAGHSVYEYRPIATSLLAAERWASQQHRARVEHPRMWEAIRYGLEVSSERVTSARYPQRIITEINELRWGDFQRANEKIGMRRWRPEIVSAAAGIEEMVLRFDRTEGLIAPVMADARKRIADLIPSIAEVANELAEQAKTMEQKTAALAEQSRDADDPASQQQAEEQLARLDEEQQGLHEQIEQLLQALAEDANAQDLMTPEGRERARDADDSIGMIEQPTDQAAKDLEAAVNAETAEQQAAELGEAAAQQQEMAEALAKVAEHYEKLEAGEDVAETREALRQAEAELPNGREIARQYEEAERLEQMAERAQSEQQRLMQELEHELQQNPEMQEALSDIATEAVAQALKALDFAKEKEDQARKSLETSDPVLQGEKRKLVQDMREIAEEAALIARNLVAQTNTASARARDPDTANKARQAQQKLDQAANRARQVSENQLLGDMQKAAAEVQQSLNQAIEQLSEAANQASKHAEALPAGGEREQADLKRDMETVAKRTNDALVRDMKSMERNADAYQRAAQQRERTASNTVRTEEQQFQRAEQDAKKSPDNVALQERKQIASNRLERAKQVAANEQALVKDAEARKQAITKQRQEAERQKPAPLDSKNPAAEYASRTAEQATEMAKQLMEKAANVASSQEAADRLAASESQLEAVRQTQDSVGEDVAGAAEDLRRAARHEERLGALPAAESLDKTASDVANVAKNEVASAQQAAEAARDAAKTSPEPANAGQASPSATTATAVQQASDAIGQQAASVAEMLAQSEAAAQRAESGAEQSQTSASPASEAQPNASAQASPSGSESQAASPNSQPPGDPGSAQPGSAQPSGEPSADAASNPSGQPSAPSSSSQPAAGSTPASASTTEQRGGESDAQRGQRLAELLDDLDRAMNAASASAQSDQQASSAMPSLSQLAAQQASQMAQQRGRSREPSQQPSTPQNAQESGEGADLQQMDDQALAAGDVNRLGSDWGKLREQNAENATSGKRSEFATQYRDQIQAYFKVIAERSGAAK